MRDSFFKSFIFLLLVSFLLQSNVVFAEVIRLEPTSKNEIKLKDTKSVLDKNLVIKDRDVIEDLIKTQKDEEIKDIELLWRATIDNNALIKCA